MTKPLAVEITHESQWKSQNVSRIAILKKGIELARKVKKLQSSGLYKEIIGDLYIKDEAANLVALIADPAANSVDQQNSIRMRLGGISALQSFMRQYAQAGATAEAEVAQLEAINTRLDAGILVEEILADLEAATQQGG